MQKYPVLPGFHGDDFCVYFFILPFFAIVANVQNVTQVAQSTVGITVFFADDLPEERILSIGDEIRSWGEVREMEYVSAEEAWESFKSEYFKGVEDLAEGFADDNPLAGSASFTIS